MPRESKGLAVGARGEAGTPVVEIAMVVVKAEDPGATSRQDPAGRLIIAKLGPLGYTPKLDPRALCQRYANRYTERYTSEGHHFTCSFASRW